MRVELLYLLVVSVSCLENGLLLTPPMGWMPWARFMCDVNCEDDGEELFISTADILNRDGYAAAGYRRIHIDDCWMTKHRDERGDLVADPDRFPHGIKWLVAEMRARSLSLGLYLTYGKRSCMGYAGTWTEGDMQRDAAFMAESRVDYVKMDGCFNEASTLPGAYIRMGDELNNTGHGMAYACSWPFYVLLQTRKEPDYASIVRHCNIWRNFNDIEINYKSILSIIDFYTNQQEKLAKIHGPGHWNDPDMLVVGNPSLSTPHARVQMTFWCLWSAPLIMSNHLPEVPPEHRRILVNQRMIAIDQDVLGRFGQRVEQRNDVHIYVKQVAPFDDNYAEHDPNHYSYVIVFFNRGASIIAESTVTLSDILPSDLDPLTVYGVQNQWTGEYMGQYQVADKLGYNVAPEDVMVVKLIVLTHDNKQTSSRLLFGCAGVTSILLFWAFRQRLRRTPYAFLFLLWLILVAYSLYSLV